MLYAVLGDQPDGDRFATWPLDPSAWLCDQAPEWVQRRTLDGAESVTAKRGVPLCLFIDGTEEEFVAKMRAVVEHDVVAMEEFRPGSAQQVDTSSRPPVGWSPKPTHGDLADAKEIGYWNLVI